MTWRKNVIVTVCMGLHVHSPYFLCYYIYAGTTIKPPRASAGEINLTSKVPYRRGKISKNNNKS